jgi:hypothetical protein
MRPRRGFQTGSRSWGAWTSPSGTQPALPLSVPFQARYSALNAALASSSDSARPYLLRPVSWNDTPQNQISAPSLESTR